MAGFFKRLGQEIGIFDSGDQTHEVIPIPETDQVWNMGLVEPPKTMEGKVNVFVVDEGNIDIEWIDRTLAHNGLGRPYDERARALGLQALGIPSLQAGFLAKGINPLEEPYLSDNEKTMDQLHAELQASLPRPYDQDQF